MRILKTRNRIVAIKQSCEQQIANGNLHKFKVFASAKNLHSCPKFARVPKRWVLFGETSPPEWTAAICRQIMAIRSAQPKTNCTEIESIIVDNPQNQTSIPSAPIRLLIQKVNAHWGARLNAPFGLETDQIEERRQANGASEICLAGQT